MRRGAAVVAFTGGDAAQALYRHLAVPHAPWVEEIPWREMHACWGDERPVPPSHPDSNFGMAAEALFSRVPIPASQIHRMRGELEAADAARAYEHELEDVFREARRADSRFDVMLLGLGADAHIASLFPQSPALGETERSVVAVWVPHLAAYRITLSPPAILAAHHILMMTAGPAKAVAVAAALEGPSDPTRWPAQLLRAARNRVEWFIDREAARGLRGPSS